MSLHLQVLTTVKRMHYRGAVHGVATMQVDAAAWQQDGADAATEGCVLHLIIIMQIGGLTLLEMMDKYRGV